MRRQGVIVEGMSWYFAQFNRNKRSITLDLYADEGKEILARLIERADVLVENYRPGVLERMGFGEARLADLNADLVVASINGYGSTGPYADRAVVRLHRPGHERLHVGQRQGRPARPCARPRRSATSWPASTAPSGWRARWSRAGGGRARGQRVESSLVNGLISMMAYLSAQYLATGELPARTGNDHPIAAPYGLFHAADGEVAIAPSTDDVVRRLFRALDIEAALDRPGARHLRRRASSTATPSTRWSASAFARRPSTTGSST